jgi:hypothetical protein
VRTVETNGQAADVPRSAQPLIDDLDTLTNADLKY